MSCSRNTTSLEQELTTAMEQRRAALAREDADGYSTLTADDLVVIDDDGRYCNKASILEQIKREGSLTFVHKISDLRAK
jgi:ketosteroid isomerase-like protein